MKISDSAELEVIFFYRSLKVVTPHDTNNLPFVANGLRVNVAGTVKVRTEAGDEVSIYMNAGQIEPGRFVRVFATGTDANLGIHAVDPQHD